MSVTMGQRIERKWIPIFIAIWPIYLRTEEGSFSHSKGLFVVVGWREKNLSRLFFVKDKNWNYWFHIILLLLLLLANQRKSFADTVWIFNFYMDQSERKQLIKSIGTCIFCVCVLRVNIWKFPISPLKKEDLDGAASMLLLLANATTGYKGGTDCKLLGDSGKKPTLCCTQTGKN